MTTIFNILPFAINSTSFSLLPNASSSVLVEAGADLHADAAALRRITELPVRSMASPFSSMHGPRIKGPGFDLEHHKKVAEALRRHKGDREKAARELGITANAIRQRVFHAKSVSPLYYFKVPTSDRALAALLKQFDGDIQRIEEEYFLPPAVIKTRISQADDFSPLAEFKEINEAEVIAAALANHKGNSVSAAKELEMEIDELKNKIFCSRNRLLAPFKPTDAFIARSLRKNGGDKKRVAAEFGASYGGLQDRINRAEKDSPLYSFQEPDVSDEKLTAALTRHSGNHKATADELGLDRRQIGPRIDRAESGSPLLLFRVSDARIAELMAKHEGNPRPVAKEMGVTNFAVVHRINIAPPESPLAYYQTGGMIDFDLAAALGRHGYDVAKIAAEIHLNPYVIIGRIGRAKPTSPLWRAKKSLKKKS